MKQISMKAVAASMVVVALLMATAVCAQAQGRFSVSFEYSPIATVLEKFKNFEPSFAYVLPEGMEGRVVTVGLADVTVEEALPVVLGQVNLAYEKANGTYTIHEQDAVREPAVWALSQYGSPVFAVKSAVPGVASGTADGPAAGAQRGTPDAWADRPIRLLQVQYGDPALLAELFGGYAIYGDQAGMMGGTTRGTGTQRGGAGAARPGGVAGTARPGGATGTARPGGGFGGGGGGGGRGMGYGRTYGG